MSALERRLRIAFAWGLAISLALHALVLLPWMVIDWSTPTPPPPRPPEPLVVDLFGMVSNRQTEQQQVGRKAPDEKKAEAPPTPVRAAMPPPPKPVVVRKDEEVRERPQPQRVQATPSPVQVEKPVEAAVAAPAAPVAAAPVSPAGAEEERTQQTLRPRDTDAAALRRYIASLKKVIEGKLVYPPEAREAGYVGASKIRFTLTESGEILSGSLAVQTSSGYPALDESALRAALSGAPFEKPPRPMAVAITLNFVRDSP